MAEDAVVADACVAEHLGVAEVVDDLVAKEDLGVAGDFDVQITHTDRDGQRQTETDRDRQRQTETDRDR